MPSACSREMSVDSVNMVMPGAARQDHHKDAVHN